MSAPDHAGPAGPAARTGRTRIPIACTLEEEAMPDRLDDWRRLLGQATSREPIDGGARVRFASADPAFAGELAALAAAEQSCCAFFRFAVVIEDGTLALEVRAPEEGAAVVAALVGLGTLGTLGA